MSADSETLGVYAREAETYADLPSTPQESGALDTFMGMLPTGASVLDLGCGPGLHAARMAAAGYRLTCWDASPEFIAAARSRGLDAELREFGELEADAAFDGVWASFSLLHAPKAEFPGHLARIRRALVPDGVLFLGLKLGEGERRDRLGRFYAYFSEQELCDALASAGFRIASVKTGAGRGLDGSVAPFILIHAHG